MSLGPRPMRFFCPHCLRNLRYEDIEERLQKCFVLGGHKTYAIAKVAKEVEIILISSLHKKLVQKMFMIPANGIQDALTLVQKKHGSNFNCYIIPNGSVVLPQIK